MEFFWRGEKKIIIWFGSQAELFAASFFPHRKILQDVLHCHHLRMALPNPHDWASLVHVILISTGTCANLTSSNWNDWSQRCCLLWPRSHSSHARKDWLMSLQVCEAAPWLSAVSLELTRHLSWVYSLTYKVLSSPPLLRFCELSKESYFHNVNISLCFETFSHSLKAPFKAWDWQGTFGCS